MCVAKKVAETVGELAPIAVVAKMLGMSERTLYRMISCGQFPEAEYRRGGMVGRRLRLWRRSTVLAWIDTNTAVAGPT